MCLMRKRDNSLNQQRETKQRLYQQRLCSRQSEGEFLSDSQSLWNQILGS